MVDAEIPDMAHPKSNPHEKQNVLDDVLLVLVVLVVFVCALHDSISNITIRAFQSGGALIVIPLLLYYVAGCLYKHGRIKG